VELPTVRVHNLVNIIYLSKSDMLLNNNKGQKIIKYFETIFTKT